MVVAIFLLGSMFKKKKKKKEKVKTDERKKVKKQKKERWKKKIEERDRVTITAGHRPTSIRLCPFFRVRGITLYTDVVLRNINFHTVLHLPLSHWLRLSLSLSLSFETNYLEKEVSVIGGSKSPPAARRIVKFSQRRGGK